MNKLSMAVILTGLFLAPSTLMAHDNSHPYCDPVCKCQCQNRFPDSCFPILRRVRPTRRARCEFYCTKKTTGNRCAHQQRVPANAFSSPVSSHQNLAFHVRPVHNPSTCHDVCNTQFTSGTEDNYVCNATCHDPRILFSLPPGAVPGE